MKDRLRGLLSLDAIMPAVLVAAAVIMTLQPTILGVAISDREIVLGFFGFLGVDALIERSGRLNRIERILEDLADRTATSLAAGKVLRPRSSFEWMEILVAPARKSVLIIGINLEGALQCTSMLVQIARRGGTVRLLAMDPDGEALGPSAATAGVDASIRRRKIIQNLELLQAEFDAQLDARARDKVTLMVTSGSLPCAGPRRGRGSRRDPAR